MKYKNMIALAAIVSSGSVSANSSDPIYPDQLKLFDLGPEICGESYRAVTRDEALRIKPAIVSKMGHWQISGLANNWVIMGAGYYGEIKQGSANTTWCYPKDGVAPIPVLSTLSIPAGDEVEIQWRFVNDDYNFIQPVSYLAHDLGYAWVAGNGSGYVGEDMDVHREGDSWRIQGNNQGSCGGYRCGEKTSIKVDNFAYTLDEAGFSHGDVTESGKQLIKTVTANAVNNSDVPQQVIVQLSYDTSSSWSKTDTYGFSEKVATKNTFKWPLVGETDVSIEIAANQSWSSQNGASESHRVSLAARPVIPANSTMPVRIAIYKSSISYPYEFKADISYDLTLNGFLRWGGNAWHTHPEDRPTMVHTFTIGRWAGESNSISYQWDKRYIPGEIRWWDWSWTINEYGLSAMQRTLARVLRPVQSAVSGHFYAENQFAGDIEIGYPKVNQLNSSRDADHGVALKDINFNADEMELLGFESVELSITPVVQSP
ncbi:aerolysin family beta-barrel pore-forming toxin [Moritella sp. 5]|uniref:aerolysin family beta-barrel pore-forming toxin n=1 Tax=Moritella sp. 5 TaxID=2746231 RepID=UPI001BAC6401|nr:aerolysin family beta-barrel pore-forming toxin [Moritella sp. 5]QUM81824.1 aerolysin family beta-barrel pore-forming toxin [Moritella sp. 5]